MYHRVGSSAYKEGLENIETLADITGHPENTFKSVHIAGTNGKGSVGHLLSSYFQECGLKTGLYTSPHLVDFTERIKVNGVRIPEDKVVDFFQKYKERFDPVQPSFFEMTTMLAFDYFASEKVDMAVIETGLGGRLDSTNIIMPVLSVITNISLDHTQFLGNTLSAIAAEKAGIIKEGIPVVIGEFNPETFPVFEEIADRKHAPLYLADRRYKIAKGSNQNNVYERLIRIESEGRPVTDFIRFPLSGDYQLKNLVTFLEAAHVLKDIVPYRIGNIQHAIEHVVENTRFRGRWQIISQQPLTICDVGHNTDGITFISNQIKHIDYHHLHFVLGMVNDKDVDNIIQLLPKHKSTYYLCRADIERALDPDLLGEKMRALGYTVMVYTTVPEAYRAARQNAEQDDLIFIGGSCFVVGDLLKSLEQ